MANCHRIRKRVGDSSRRPHDEAKTLTVVFSLSDKELRRASNFLSN